MSDTPSPNGLSPSHTLTHICVDGVCHCDWRIAINDCQEHGAITIINIVNIALSAFVIVVGLALLFYRIVIKHHAVFELRSKKGFLRPKPVESMLLLLVIFNILRLLTSLILLIDVAPTNLIARSFLFEISWQFGYGGFALYLVGIAQALSETHKSIATGWLPSPLFVDILGSWFFLWPFVINNICSIVAGALATTNLQAAEVFTRLLYGFWFLHNSTITTAVLYSGWRLISILNRNLTKFKTSGARYTSIKKGIFKIKMIIAIIAVCLMTFATFLLLYGILRNMIIVNFPGSIFLAVIWTYLGPVTTIFVELAIIINPVIKDNPALALKSSGGDIMSEDTVEESYVTTESNSTLQGTMDLKTFDDIKHSQTQYEQVFHKHSAGPMKSSFVQKNYGRHQNRQTRTIENCDVEESSQIELTKSTGFQ
ncbi:uncharacterized protein BYT42DRAFT_579638 [Radiomyces spectabilis]|uniref:uncharacterized protein n=1 Tax=Radiomyces spectabilis TaxID=64574 RepID=UPI002220AFD7|nr:uncharacterized protein BYT42DRAFT_579638 [Radiomyces spectabilis]KAI8373221.1 hypothetical protein BYT42DRAFT_579638 [Radiomyces spectabilis]